MKYTQLGRSGIKVSRLCLGTMNFCPGFIAEDESAAIMSRALEIGINFFDTANVYGDYYSPQGVGTVEEIVGRWLAKDPGRRQKIVLATKVYNIMGEGQNDRGLSAYHIRKACEDSLRRLQTDHIDLYQMHHIDRSVLWEEIWQAMEGLVQQGKIIYTGSSNFAGWHIAQAVETAHQRNFMGLVSEQSLYNLKDRTVELEVIPACQEYGMGLLPWSPLRAGFLGGILKKQVTNRRKLEPWLEDLISKNQAALEAYDRFCDELGEQPADVALAWLLHNPVVTAPIVGPRNLDQLNGSLRALEIKLDADHMKRLDEIWPGPGGPAPEAYAW
jgi:aryl-alcohol dehydrogenase-like predicted oxidoreductase